MTLKQLYHTIALTLPLTWLGACSVDVPPPDLYSDPDAITNVEAARSLLTSCYTLYPHYEYEFSTLGNDFCLTSLSGKDINQQNLYNWQDKDISSLATDMWLAYYNCIANCDVLMERLDKVKTASTSAADAKRAITAEVKTLKALCYFQLLRIYAPAYSQGGEADGIVLKNRVGLEFPKRSSLAQCVDYIRTLLTEAAAVDNAPKRNGWLSQQAARQLLAQLSLYTGQYDEALAQAKEVLSHMPAGALSASQYPRLWDTATWEGRIFAFNTAQTYYNSLEYSATEGDLFALNPALRMENTDARRASNELAMTMAGEERTLLGKYNLHNKKGLSTAYIDQMRYAETLFIAAECEARTGHEAEARQRVNTYLEDMGATPLNDNLTGTALVKAILNEKCRELAGEGHNWFDLKRTGTTLPRLKRWATAIDKNISADDYRWTFPIPSSEYKYNESVTQNPGWPLNRN